MGIVAALGGDFGETQQKLLFTTLSVFGMSAITVVCVLAWERGRLGPIPVVGIVLGVIGFAALLYGIWWEPDFEYRLERKVFFSGNVVTVAAAHASLVAVSGTLQRYRWASYAAYGLNVLAIVLTLIAIWSEIDGDGFWRFYVVAIVLLIAVTIAVPVLSRLEGAPEAEASPGLSSTSAKFCPLCAAALEPRSADACAACGAGFRIRITGP